MNVLPIVLMLLGLAFIIAEIFVVSFGVLSLIAGALILGADILAFEISPAYGWVLIVLQLILIPLTIRGAFKALPKLPFGRRMLLDGPVTPKGGAGPDLEPLAGRHGRALTDLRPSGKADIDGRRVSVVAAGRMIPEGTELVVVDVEGSEVRVRPLHPLPEDEQD